MVRSTLFRGVFQPKPGSKNENSRNCMRASEFYISNAVEFEYPNDLSIYQRLGVAKIQIFDEKSKISTHFVNFRKETGRTGARRFDIRNHRIFIIRKRLHLHPGAQSPAVTRTGRSAIWVAIWEFSKSRKT